MSNQQETPQEHSGSREIIYVPAQYPAQEAEDEIDLIQLWGILWQGKWFILFFVFLATLAAMFISLNLLPVTYKASATIEPTAREKGGGIRDRLGGLASNLPIDLPSGGSSPTTMLNYLKSRNLQKKLIQEYDLLPVLYKSRWNEKEQKWEVDSPEQRPTITKALQNNALGNLLSVSQEDESGLINISSVSEDPELAQQMVQRTIQELRGYLENEYETDEKRELDFVQKQLEEAEEELNYWEDKVPTQELSLSKIERERSAAQSVYAELRKQLELAKISAKQEEIRFKVLDEPFVPEERYKPNRAMISALTMVASGFVAVFLVFFRQFLISARKRYLEG